MNCPNCRSHKIIIFHNKVWSIDNGKVYRCEECELLFIDPMMNEEEENDFYKNYNQHIQSRGLIVENSITELHKKSKVVANERLNIVNKFFKDKKVLEIGSSTGAFLSLLHNCETHACELAKDNLEYSKQFINGNTYSSIDEIKENSFDVICMYHVFEHIRNPIEFLNICRLLLSQQGCIVIEVPHSHDPLITLFDCKEFKDFVFQPMHPMVYNEKSLDYVFEKSNFKKKEVIYYQRYGLENHLSWLKNKRPGGDTILSEIFSNNMEYKKKLQSIQLTDTIFYIAEIK